MSTSRRFIHLAVLFAILFSALGGFNAKARAQEMNKVPSIELQLETPRPLPTDCDGVADPLTPPEDVCCVFGYIYLNGMPQEGVTVQITSIHSQLNLVTAVGAKSNFPYYSADLASAPLSVISGENITIRATSASMSSVRSWTAQGGSQQVDIGLIPGYQAPITTGSSALDSPFSFLRGENAAKTANTNLSPTIIQVTPARNALAVPMKEVISVKFSEEIKSGTLTPQSFQVFGALTGKLAGNLSYDNGVFTAAFSPTGSYKPGEEIWTAVTNQVQGITGSPVAPSTWHFTARGSGASATFASGVDYPAGSHPYQVAAGDLDGDGDLDLVTANTQSNNISVLLNSGNGIFASPVNFSLTAGSYAVALADVDGDGDLDIAAASDPFIALLKNNGNGNFSSAGLFEVGNGPFSIVPADLDADGDLDLAVARNPANMVTLLFNQGNGMFGNKTDNATGTAPCTVVAGDLENDGDIDLAVTNNDSSDVSVLLNNGNGVMAPQVRYTVANKPWGLSIGDLNNDGRLDLAATGYLSNKISVLLNLGSASFAAHVDYDSSLHPSAVVMADLDGDSDLDLAAANNGTVNVLRNNGSGVFPITTSFTSGDGPHLVAGDFNGDGAVDLATENYSGSSVTIFINISTPRVIDVTPGRNALKVDKNANLTATFNQPMNSTTLSVQSMPVYASQTGHLTGTFTYNNSLNKVTFDLNDMFKPGETVTGVITSQVKSASAEAVTPTSWQFTAKSAGGSGNFTAPAFFDAGSYPYHVATGDLDGDGDLDLAVANTQSNNFSVLLNNGNGTFAPAVNYAVSAACYALGLADLDADGDLDVAVSSGSDIKIFKNNGSGSLVDSVSYEVGTGIYGLAVSDLDNDGDMDLAAARTGTTYITLLFNQGGGTFSGKVDYLAGTSPSTIVAGDLDKDGDIDLVSANHDSNNISIFINNGSGVFASQTISGLGNPWGLGLGDVNNDFLLDIAVTDYHAQQVYVLINTGSGSFGTPVEYTTDQDPNEVVLADLNGDGFLDLATINGGGNSISVLRNNGDGTFTAESHFDAGIGPRHLAAGDLDNDGDIDLVTAIYSGSTVAVLLNQNAEAAPWVITTTPLRNSLTAGATANLAATFSSDMNPSTITTQSLGIFGTKTGRLSGAISYSPSSRTVTFDPAGLFKPGEVIWASVNSQARGASGTAALPNSWQITSRALGGSGTFSSPAAYSAGSYPYWVASGDLDGDGDLDLVTANTQSNNISIIKNNGSGSFAAPVNYGLSAGSFTVEVIDVDSDGDLDLAASSDPYIDIFKNNGSGSFSSAGSFLVGSGPFSIIPADLDSDGDLDLAVARNPANKVTLLFNQGNGTFAGLVDYAVGTSPCTVAAGDFDSDGDIDLAVTNHDSNDLSVLLNTGNGIFAPQVRYVTAGKPWGLVVGDLNGDGNIDLAATGYLTNKISVLLNQGDGTFAPRIDLDGGYHPSHVVMADLDGDGDLDLAAADGGDGTIAVLKNNGSGIFTSPVSFASGDAPHLVAGDMDGDGDIDLVEANYTGHSVSVLKNNNSSGFIPPIALFIATPSTGPVPLSVAFGNSSHGDIVSWDWDFGDELISGARFPGHKYENPGSFTVLLTVSGPAGHDDLTIANCIRVTFAGDLPPVAEITSIYYNSAPGPAIQGTDTIYFDGSGYDQDENGATIVAYQWRSSLDGILSDQEDFTRPASSLSISTHTIYFKVKDNEGGWSEEVSMLLVVRPAQIDFTTLILVNRQKLLTLFGEENAIQVMSRLNQLATHPRVKGIVLQVENNSAVSASYAQWDLAPSDITKANAVTQAVKTLIDTQWNVYQSLSYLVIVGDDRAIPFRRVLDQTGYGENMYKDVSCSSVTGSALCGNMTLTDDFYGDASPTIPDSSTWDGHNLYIPDLGIGRLVETPAEIMGQIDAFLTNDSIAVDRVVVTGYDFVQDGAAGVCSTIIADGTPADCALIGEGWDRDDFLTSVLGTAHNIASINGHANHSTIGTPSGVVSSSDLLAASANLERELFFTVGCHSGLNVPADNPVQPLDTVQALAQRKANYIANTGYGWGYRASVGLSEKLTVIFSQRLMYGQSATLGQALVAAKQNYYFEEGDFDFYDEKVLIESTLYGLPMYRYITSSSTGLLQPSYSERELPEMIDQQQKSALGGVLTINTYTAPFPALLANDTPDGTFYTAGRYPYSGNKEPIQPKQVYNLSTPLTKPHGIVFRGGFYVDQPSFNPVIDQAFIETASAAEPDFTAPGFYPPFPLRLNRLSEDAASVVVAGQYNPLTKSERLYDLVQYAVYYHTVANDWTAPWINGIHSMLESGLAKIAVQANDASGIEAVIIAYTDGEGQWKSIDLSKSGATWTGSFAANDLTVFIVQVVDKAGNVAVNHNTGRYFKMGEGYYSNVTFLPFINK